MSEKPTYEELEQRVNRLEAMIKNSQIAIVQLTEDNIITEINPAFNRLFGFEQKDVVGTSIRWLSRSGDDGTGNPEYGLRYFTIQPGGEIPIHNHFYHQTMYF